MVTPSTAEALSSATQIKENPDVSGRAVVPQPDRKHRAMRKYRIKSLCFDGSVRETEQIGPATPVFEAAFSAFAHGTVIQTSQGQVAIEDIYPGMKVKTADRCRCSGSGP